MENQSEIKRIIEAYEKRKLNLSCTWYSFFNTANLFIIQSREREVLRIFKKLNIELENAKVLDIGCGSGGELRNLIRYGAKPGSLVGIDLLQDRINLASRISPNVSFICGDACSLPFEDESFDILMCYTVFSSILDDKVKRCISKEMIRVLRPGGIVLWYDFHINNPRNKDVKAVKKKEVYNLFPKCNIFLKNITLAPPITRRIAPYSWLICYVLEKIKILNTHYIGIIKK